MKFVNTEKPAKNLTRRCYRISEKSMFLFEFTVPRKFSSISFIGFHRCVARWKKMVSFKRQSRNSQTNKQNKTKKRKEQTEQRNRQKTTLAFQFNSISLSSSSNSLSPFSSSFGMVSLQTIFIQKIMIVVRIDDDEKKQKQNQIDFGFRTCFS